MRMEQVIAFNTATGHSGRPGGGLPEWVSEDVRLYLDHVEGGQTIRALARNTGVHASTILRKVRKTEARRDDPLIDRALLDLGQLRRAHGADTGDPGDPAADLARLEGLAVDAATLRRDACRVLRALIEPGAVLAVVPDVETAVVVVETEDGRPRQVATLARRVAEAMALLNWIEGSTGTKVARYHVTGEGRQALNYFLASTENARMGGADGQGGNVEGIFAGAAGGRAAKKPRKPRAAGADSPLQVLARRRDKSGQPYLSAAQIRAGEDLRTDFELAQLDGQVGANWTAIMGGRTDRTRTSEGAGAGRRLDARRRLEAALKALGPELADVALMTCCHLKGMERVESEMQMPARSGKYVLRIALNILARHYARTDPERRDLIY